ncbi:4'-phosphopantetheinyl transferase family protein [Antricoccus suffuscus]|nr:4'-phosphopantetheinyl transferase superfamily protein [Antricoccus suffuscus]
MGLRGHTNALIAAALAIPQSSICIGKRCATCGSTDHGKPYLVNAPGQAISIAHAGDWTVVASYAGPSLGIDLESTDHPMLEPSDLLTVSEARRVGELPAVDRSDALRRLWVRKEAVVKATGTGLAVPLASIALEQYDERHYLASGRLLERPMRVIDVPMGTEFDCAVAIPADQGFERVEGRIASPPPPGRSYDGSG